MPIFDIPLNETREERLARLRRGVFVSGTPWDNQGGVHPGKFFNPGRIAGTVPQGAGEVGPNYNARVAALNPLNNYDAIDRSFSTLTESRPPPATMTTQLPKQLESPEVQESRRLWTQRETSKKLMAQGAAGVSFGTVNEPPQNMPPAGGIVEQLLKGPPVADKTSGDLAAPAAAVSGFGGTMRPIELAPGTDLLTMKQLYTGTENDPVLAERRAEFDRNLTGFLKRPDWKSRAEYEQGIARIPGAGQEILGHIQQRALENMPAPMVQEWEQTQATRVATAKTLTAAAADEAAYQQFLKTATPEQVAQFHEGYERTPSGWKPARQTAIEKNTAAYENFIKTATPEEITQFKKDYERIPTGWRKKVSSFDEIMKTMATTKTPIEDTRGWRERIFGTKPAEQTPATPPAGGQDTGAMPAFTDEASARTAGYKTGDIVLINGRRARLN